MNNEIINKVAKSGLIQLDMADFFPIEEIIEYDIAQNLWQEIALKEKDFRAFIKENDWSTYQNKHVALTCSVDAIIPSWAYMLLSSALQEFAVTIHFGSKQEVEQQLLLQAIRSINSNEYQDTRIVIKGCGDRTVSEAAWVEITNKLQPFAKSLMYGEPCSTVPVYKRPK
ncbi:DUF2480 family protein [Salibacteraceae bacterium]|jgi:hypothetical protein|nr:hypothetical protein [Crocinitomicaceae bacterium]MDA9967778.1 DUF2480 family protein [Salibacteraceae bacterium]|tara:strand:+ start:20282 stop:20791 length:510 start_codon:yes stop_codon:yes gene_type:complete